MRRPTKLKLHLLKHIKTESCARMRKRISKSVRECNGYGIKTNWMYQADRA